MPVDEVVKPIVEESNDFVPKKAFSDVSNDMHKYKAKLKETEAILNQLKAEKDTRDIEEKKEKQQWEQLYQTSEEKLRKIEAERSQEKNKFLDYHKKQALISKLGGFKKDEYASFVNVDSIQLDDNGNVVQESLDAECNRIRQNYPDLLKTQNSQPLPSEAPRSFNTTVNNDISKMSEKERATFRMSLLTKNK